MHDYILFISTEKIDLKINTSSLCPDDIGMYGIADYIGEELPFPERLAGVSVGQDGKIVFTKQDIERFFKWRFDTPLKKGLKPMSYRSPIRLTKTIMLKPSIRFSGKLTNTLMSMSSRPSTFWRQSIIIGEHRQV